jgi:hypothetical protein
MMIKDEHLHVDQWVAKDRGVIVDVAHELLDARIGRQRGLPEILEPHVGVGLHEHRPFGGTLHREPASG